MSYTCEGHGKGFELRVQTNDYYCNGVKKITCSGPGWECYNEATAEVREAQDVNDAPIFGEDEPCFCPLGRRRLMINPDLFTCEPHGAGFELRGQRNKFTCPNGSERFCGGPGWECYNEDSDEAKEALSKSDYPSVG